ncbi:hypothetical protein AtNW77_Chr5g0106031 [Arabidopsis thaliana]
METSSAIPPPPPPRVGWWSRPIVTVPLGNDREPTCKETTVCLTPCCAGLFTIVAVYLLIFHVVNNAHCHAKFSIQSITVSPSSATWHVDFLVKNPSPRYSIYYGPDETAVSLGTLNAAVLDTFHERKSRSHTAFSVDFIAEGNPNGVVFKELYVKLKAKRKIYGNVFGYAGHIDIRCQNLTRSYENVEKIHFHSSYTDMEALTGSHSVSVSNANVSTADWTIGFVAKSPVTGCKISLHPLNARLLRGGEVISKSASYSSDYFVTGDKPDVLFEKVVKPEVIGDVIWHLRVEVLFAMDTDVSCFNGFLIAVCPDIAVKFTTDPAGKGMGSLLGHMRWCDYEFREKLDSSHSIFSS